MSTENYNASFKQKTSYTIGVSVCKQRDKSNVLFLMGKRKVKALVSLFCHIMIFFKLQHALIQRRGIKLGSGPQDITS